ncbi:hypothetical protein L1987_19044 [Smallanthus sonchifolius]|uniref:Uncharacterized protein n=1 Tax=Smallanthus sonchifolius TaxID=185202 RepID=A0ACB9J3M3_9ASTR|nr:hypothetical protein L1987_19044 [Smallanthus sonchifolius]
MGTCMTTLGGGNRDDGTASCDGDPISNIEKTKISDEERSTWFKKQEIVPQKEQTIMVESFELGLENFTKEVLREKNNYQKRISESYLESICIMLVDTQEGMILKVCHILCFWMLRLWEGPCSKKRGAQNGRSEQDTSLSHTTYSLSL